MGQSDILRTKADEARRQAYEDELGRLEKEISFSGQETLRNWLTAEEAGRVELRTGAGRERDNQIRGLKNREQELLRQLDEEERRKAEDFRRRRSEESRRKKDEEDKKREKEEEEQRRKKSQSGPSKEELAKLEKSKGYLATAEAFLAKADFESALAEVSKGLSILPEYPDGVALREKIRQAGIFDPPRAGGHRGLRPSDSSPPPGTPATFPPGSHTSPASECPTSPASSNAPPRQSR